MSFYSPAVVILYAGFIAGVASGVLLYWLIRRPAPVWVTILCGLAMLGLPMLILMGLFLMWN